MDIFTRESLKHAKIYMEHYNRFHKGADNVERWNNITNMSFKNIFARATDAKSVVMLGQDLQSNIHTFKLYDDVNG